MSGLMFPKTQESTYKIDTSGLRFPKSMQKKRKKIQSKSILQQKTGHCFLCMLNDDYRIHKDLHEHHVFNGPDREASEEEGFTVYLCIKHHIDGPEAVHHNRENDLILKRYAQMIWEETHTREEFQKRFRKSYL